MIKSILVHLNDEPACDTRLTFAKSLADRFDAAISGLHFSPATFSVPENTPELLENSSNVTVINQRVSEEIQDAVTQEKVAIQKKVDELFDKKKPIEWETFSGSDDNELIDNCLYHDLVVLSHSLNISDLLNQLQSTMVTVASGSGCPVCVLPSAIQNATSLTHPIIAWNQSRATARAVTDSLPFLQAAENVIVYCERVSEKHSKIQRLNLERLSNYLTRHDVTHEIVFLAKEEKSFTLGLLKYIEHNRLDLLVMGAYDHTKVREVMIGMTARKVMQQVEIPVLLSY